ncbi:hypothetical protein [Bacterioplanoides sp.]|uniref:hypothetical protein n=1 Tax=Bacterioplanoides sp. TaxID=2066072 RepID=UPI003B5AFB95
MMQEKWKGLVFLDVKEDLIENDTDLGHGLLLRKATMEELSNEGSEWHFRSFSERRGTLGLLNQRLPLTGNRPGGHPISDPSQWRHAVIECSDPNLFYWNVNIAFSIAEVDLRMGYVTLESGATSTPYLEFSMLNIRNSLGAMFVDHELPSACKVNLLKKDLNLIIPKLNMEFPSEVRKIISLYLSLDNLPDSSPFKVLGYFSVIEGLLSHSPQPEDRMDSIQRQLIRNINLLNNRLKLIDRDINFSAFGETNITKVLKLLYAYRSAVAHGGKIETPIKAISKLRQTKEETDHLWVHDWLRLMTKRLILAAIIEPELVMDLK